MALFHIENLSFSYPDQEKKALDQINLTIEPGEFLSLCGRSGCGKTTLLRHLKPSLTPFGKKEGSILFHDENITELNLRKQAQCIGYVLQNPDNQIVTDKVWHELAFGLESLGVKSDVIRLRTAEMASFFGIEDWFYKKVTELSGGQKQLLNLASIMAMQPEVLFLDEPTSQLDPIAASDFLKTVYRINRELGTTVLLTEHRMEETFPVSDRIIVMENGKILLEDTPYRVGKQLKDTSNQMFLSMPTPMQIYARVENDLDCPLTVREGRKWLTDLNKVSSLTSNSITDSQIKPTNAISRPDQPVIELKDVWFRYEKDGKDIIKDLTLEINKGAHYCILGGNGAGKTTTLNLIGGIYKPYRGKILINKRPIQKITHDSCKLGILPQNPQTLFVKKTVRLDLLEILSGSTLHKKEKEEKIKEIAEKTEIIDLLDMHPYDLSGGEQQRAALAKVLLLEPEILLLDEPTKGMDNFLKKKFAEILRGLVVEGKTILTVSHDVEFCAEHADYCALFFQGTMISQGSTQAFFSGNCFYTTAANRMARHLFPNAITIEDVIRLCQKNNK